MSTNFEIIEEKIKNLYKFRNEFFLVIDENEWPNKQQIIENKIKIILDEIEYYNENIINNNNENNNIENKAKYYYLKGWLLNIREQYNQIVFDSLTKFIKFNPDNIDAWLELGECYLKKNELLLAQNCFEKILTINSMNKYALRNLSILLRSNCQNNCNNKNDKKYENLIKSIDLAKKAIECDINDLNSWAILGNAYLTIFFQSPIKSKSDLLIRCKSAYQKVFNHQNQNDHLYVQTKSDILYNYSTILQYDEQFEQALDCLHKAYRYDNDWKELLIKKQKLLNILSDINHQYNNNNKNLIKLKKLLNIKNELKQEQSRLMKLYDNNDKLLNGKIKTINELSIGNNQDCLFYCRIISLINDLDNIFYSSIFNVIDSNGEYIIVFIYNLNKNKSPKPGDTILIIKPIIKEYLINYDNDKYQFKAIKTIDPLKELLINNLPLNIDSIAIPTISVTLKSD